MSKSFISSLFLGLCLSLPLAAPVAAQQAATPMVLASAETKVGLNTSDASALQSGLAGIGAGKAKAIVEHRDTIGKFESVDELLEVKGIGKALLERNRDRLTLE